MGEQVPVTQARIQLAELVNRVAYAGERIELTRHGRVVAALVGAEDYRQLEAAGTARPLGFVAPRYEHPASSAPGTQTATPVVMPAAAHHGSASADDNGNDDGSRSS